MRKCALSAQTANSVGIAIGTLIARDHGAHTVKVLLPYRTESSALARERNGDV
jgi:hypothetical protein